MIQMAGDENWGQEKILAETAKMKTGLGEKGGGAGQLNAMSIDCTPGRSKHFL